MTATDVFLVIIFALFLVMTLLDVWHNGGE